METTKKTQVVGIKNAGIVIICCLVKLYVSSNSY